YAAYTTQVSAKPNCSTASTSPARAITACSTDPARRSSQDLPRARQALAARPACHLQDRAIALPARPFLIGNGGPRRFELRDQPAGRRERTRERDVGRRRPGVPRAQRREPRRDQREPLDQAAREAVLPRDA